jgi:hypothetical protein
MLSGIDLTETVNFSLPDDTEPKTIWKLGVMPSYLMARISMVDINNRVDMIYKILQISLRGWDNFDVPFVTIKEKIFEKELDVIPLTTLERIPLNIISILALKVMEINKLALAETKNL